MAGEMEKRMILYFEAQGIQNIPKAVKRAKKETDLLSLSVSQLNSKYDDIDKELSLLAKGYSNMEKKGTSSLNKITSAVNKLDSATISSTARIGEAASALKGLVLPASFGSAIKVIMDYEKALLSLSAKTQSYSIGIVELESNVNSLGKSLNLTRMDILSLQDAFFSGFMNIKDPTKDFEQIMLRIKKVVGGNKEKIDEYLNLWKKTSGEFPGLSEQLLELKDSDIGAFKARVESLQKELSKEAVLMYKALADNQDKMGPEEKERIKLAKKRIELMNQFKKQIEDVAMAFTPLLKILEKMGEYLSGIKKYFQDLGVSSESLAKAAIWGTVGMTVARPILSGAVTGAAKYAAKGGLGAAKGIGKSLFTSQGVKALSMKGLKISAGKVALAGATAATFYAIGKGIGDVVARSKWFNSWAEDKVAKYSPELKRAKVREAKMDDRLAMQQKIKELKKSDPAAAKSLQAKYDKKYKKGAAFVQLEKDRALQRELAGKGGESKGVAKGKMGTFGREKESLITGPDSLELAISNLTQMDDTISKVEGNLKSTITRMSDIGGIDVDVVWDKAQQASELHRKKITQIREIQAKTYELASKYGDKTLEQLQKEGILSAKTVENYGKLGFENKTILRDISQQADFEGMIEDSTARQYENLQLVTGALSGIISREKARASLMSSTVSLMDNYAIGVGASAKVRMMEFEAHGKVVEKLKQERKLQEKIIAGSSSGSEAATKAQTKLLEIEQEILSVQQQRAASVRALRDGWIGAISAMNTGAGRFSKIMFDQQKNTGAMLGMLGQSAVISSKTGKMGRGAGYKTSEQFSAYGGIKRGKKGFAYKTWLDDVMESRYPGYGSRILGGIEKGHREEMMMETSRMMQTSGDIAGSKGGTTLGLMGHQYLKGPYLEGNTGANNITVNNNIEVRSEVSPERLQRIVNQGTSEALGLYTGRRDN